MDIEKLHSFEEECKVFHSFELHVVQEVHILQDCDLAPNACWQPLYIDRHFVYFYMYSLVMVSILYHGFVLELVMF